MRMVSPALMALICLGFALLGAVLLARNISRPIERAEQILGSRSEELVGVTWAV